MIGFSIMMWFCSVIILILGVSLVRGNYAGIHGKVFDSTEDKKGYARALGKPALLLGLGMAVAGVLAVAIRGLYSVIISVIFLLVMVVISGMWFAKIQNNFRNL